MLENFDGDGDEKLGVKGGYLENSSFWGPGFLAPHFVYCMPMENFATFLFSSSSSLFPPYFSLSPFFLPPWNFRGRGTFPTKKIRGGTRLPVPRLPPPMDICIDVIIAIIKGT